MNAKDIIALNNEMREQLNEENLTVYEEMLSYIRLSSNKSEQQTEEVLLELLEHLLEAQRNGKSAADIFGDDIKQYCDELIKEIPKEKMTNNMKFWFYIAVKYFSYVLLTFGVLSFLLNFLFDLGGDSVRFSLGTGVVVVLFELGLLYLYIHIVFKWMKSGSFKEKQSKRWVEFLQLWLISSIVILLFIFIPRLLPDFGVPITLHNLMIVALGAILYSISILLNKKYRLLS